MKSEQDNELSVALSSLGSAKNKYELAALLGKLANMPKPANTDLSPIFRLLSDDRWLVRHSAIQALKHTDSPEVETRLLSLLQTTSDPFDLIYSHSVLNHVGTSKSVPALQNSLNSKKRDVKFSAQAAITAIESRGMNKNPTVA
jgi:HEAT repeat protein